MINPKLILLIVVGVVIYYGYTQGGNLMNNLQMQGEAIYSGAQSWFSPANSQMSSGSGLSSQPAQTLPSCSGNSIVYDFGTNSTATPAFNNVGSGIRNSMFIFTPQNNIQVNSITVYIVENSRARGDIGKVTAGIVDSGTTIAQSTNAYDSATGSLGTFQYSLDRSAQLRAGKQYYVYLNAEKPSGVDINYEAFIRVGDVYDANANNRIWGAASNANDLSTYQFPMPAMLGEQKANIKLGGCLR